MRFLVFAFLLNGSMAALPSMESETTTSGTTSRSSSATTSPSSTSSRTSSSSSASSTSTSSSSALPVITQTTSYSYSVGIPEASPYVYRPHNLNGTVFIAMGATIFGVLAFYNLWRLVAFLRSKKAALSNEKPEEYHQYAGFIQEDSSTLKYDAGVFKKFKHNRSSRSSLFDGGESTIGFNGSLYSLGNASFGASTVMLNDASGESPQQGRSLRNSIYGNSSVYNLNNMSTSAPMTYNEARSRSSMFISPVNEMLSRSSLGLPLEERDMPSPTEETSREKTNPKRQRPPSMILDDLINSEG